MNRNQRNPGNQVNQGNQGNQVNQGNQGNQVNQGNPENPGNQVNQGNPGNQVNRQPLPQGADYENNPLYKTYGAAGKATIDYIQGGITRITDQAGGKTIVIIYWVIMAIIIIYMIVIAIIYYNDYTKYVWNEERQVWIYSEKDGTEEIYEGPTDEFIRTMNIHKIVMNSLLIIQGLFVWVAFCVLKYGLVLDKDGLCAFSSGMIGFYIIICIVWFIVNIVWDANNISYTNKRLEEAKAAETAETTEKFCGMMETFRGYTPESFVVKKLRKF